MQAFHNDQSIKEKYLSRVKAHYAADEIIKGKYWEDGKGCAVGCTVHSSEKELGVPQWLARVQDRLFEGMPNADAKEFPVKFLEAINIGSDLNKIKTPFLLYIVRSARNSFNHEKFPNTLKKIDAVILKIESGVAYATYAAAYADAAYADAAADAAYAAAAAAAYAAADDARRNKYKEFADELLRLMRECI